MAYTTIDDPSAHFQIALYTGNGGSNTITNDGNSDLQADWIWLKERDSTSSNHVFDSTRGVGDNGKALLPDSNTIEGDDTAFRSFDSDGFTLANTGGFNENTVTNVAWQWKANGGTTSSDSNGDQTSTVQANTTAGFSIATFAASSSAGQTVGHGLGSAPDMYIWKSRAREDNWYVYHKSAGAGGYLRLNTTDAFTSNTNVWSNTNPSSTLIYYGGNSLSTNNENHVLYSFKSIQGYSKFGAYKGNGESSGAFSYTGFKPAWIMIKRKDSSTNSDWAIYDNKRSNIGNGDNENNDFLRANDTAVEASASGLDILSNGFKIRSTSSRVNANDSVYIYIAFADNPFVSSKGVPTTAK